MALPVTDQLITQLQTESVGTSPTIAMEGNVSRPLIIKDLLSAMKDVNFSQLMGEYGSISGNPSKESTPMITGLMKDTSPKVPVTPLKKEQVKKTGPLQTQDVQAEQEEIQVPTPMRDAMAMNTLAPSGVIEQNENTGLMSDTPQQIA